MMNKPIKAVCFVILLSSYALSVSSQTPKDTISELDTVLKTNSFNHNITQREINNPFQYNFCDENGDGFMDINISEIETEILSQVGLNDNETATIFISTSNGKILKINSPFSLSNIIDVCPTGLPGYALSDVAVDENGETYITGFSIMFELITANCSLNLLFNLGFSADINSLSFDTNGNLYYGFGSNPNIYRYNADEQLQPYVWHDFVDGGSGGDFVMLNGKMYVAWKIGNSYRLYEVTVDDDINYISHIDLGELPDRTYGLASELGKLYGVTTDNLFEIDIENMSFTTIVENDGTYGDWYGAAGLHEATKYEVSTYQSQADAGNLSNPLPDQWTNTVFGGQIVYIRVDNLTTGTYEIYPVTISIGIVPQISTPSDLIQCDEGDQNIFDLTQIESELLENTSEAVEISYYESNSDMFYNINALNTQYESVFSDKNIFVYVKSANSDCFATTLFNLKIEETPNLKPLVNEPFDRLLTNCYINNLDQGYFKLNEIYNDVVIDANSDYDIQFYHSYNDAEQGINQILNTNYVSIIGVVEMLFIKVINEKGCEKITNFFIYGDCVLTSTDLSNIHFPPFFTPNDDGYNDYWNIKGVSQLMRQESQISIFNRYGKLLFTFKPFQVLGWDGNFNSYKLPEDDYWFKMTTPVGKEFSSHFTLKR